MNKRCRNGFSMLELLAVVTFMGILSAMVIARNGRSLMANFGSQGDCRRISLAMLEAKRRAITTGLEHAVNFNSNGSKLQSFSVLAIDNSGGTSVIDGPLTMNEDLDVAVSNTRMSFNFEGQAAGAYWVTLTGKNKIGRIDVIPITGTIRCTDSQH